MSGKPLIYYQIKNALKSKYIDDVVVTSDNEYILDYAMRFDILLRRRPDDLAEDHITLDPVIYDALEYAEQLTSKTYKIVVTQQPTSPLLNKDTLDKAIEMLDISGLDTIVPIIEDYHLYWKKLNGKIIPDYEKRFNRQQISPRYKETGSFLISRRDFVTRNTRFGPNVGAYILNDIEGIDIDTPTDWYLAENIFKIVKIVFIVRGNVKIGMGHIYRSLTIADRLVGHKITFIIYDSNEIARSLIEFRGYCVIGVEYSNLINVIKSCSPNIVINDILDTDSEYINSLKRMDIFVINFEDLGDGSYEADLVFNALYEKNNHPINQKFGHEFECLNMLYYIYDTPAEFNEIARKMLVSFGGVDVNNLTERVLNLIPNIVSGSSIRDITIIIGPGYLYKNELMEKIETLNDYDISLHCAVSNMPKLIQSADIALTSNGRTIYELASMGVPTISIAQNNRETLHLFARYHKGIKYLGMAQTITDEHLLYELLRVINNPRERQQMYESQYNISKEIRTGLDKIISEIMSKYGVWFSGKNNNW